MSNEELFTFLNLCEKNMDYLGMKRKLNPTITFNKEFNTCQNLRNKIYEEINKRIKNFIDENNKANI